MKKKDILILALILIIGLALRIYKIDTPLADLHSWRQVDTAAVARNFTRDGFNLLKPTYDDISSIQTGIENPTGIRMVEFPIYNAIFAFFTKYLPIVSLEVYGRLTSAIFSLITIAVLYYFALKEKNRIAAIATAGIYAIFPFFVFFSRVILPESTAVAFMMLSLFFLYIGLTRNKKSILYLIFGGSFFALSLLTKPTTIFYSFAAGYLFLRTYKFDIFKQWRPYAFFIIGIIPLIIWRIYILQFPEGIPASAWLLTQVNTFEGPKEIFFRPAFFRWMFMERMGTLIFGIYGTAFFILGAVGKYKNFFLQSILFSGFAYIFTFQGGNVQHEYYQTIALPMFALIAGVGVANIFEIPSKYILKIILYPTVFAVILFSVLFSYYKVKDYYVYPNDLPQIAELIKTFTAPEDKIVTDRSGDTTLLYLSDRKGAPAVYKSIEELTELGYRYLVTSNEGMKEDLKSRDLEIVIETDLYLMVKL